MWSTLDARLSTLARNQYGCFSRAQATEIGFSARMIQYRVQREIWLALHPGVYAIAGSPPTWEQAQMAACLWSRGLSAGRAAGFLYALPGCEHPPVEVLTTRRDRAMPRCGIVVHETSRLPKGQNALVRSIPATSVERTLMMLCVQLTRRDAAIAIDNALFRGLTSVGDLDLCLFLTARQGRGGSRVLREVIRRRMEADRIPTTPLETVIFEALVEGALPLPALQEKIFDARGFVARPDFVYREAQLVIEGHSKLWHTGLEAQVRDRSRHQRLERLGFEIVYATWPDATRYRKQFVERIRSRLRERGDPRV